jgi:hypothetical protein
MNIHSLFLRFVIYLPWWLGGYNGASNHDICQSLSDVSAAFWMRPIPEIHEFCNDLIERKIYSNSLGFLIIMTGLFIWYKIYVFVLGCCLYWITYIYRYCIQLPVSFYICYPERKSHR